MFEDMVFLIQLDKLEGSSSSVAFLFRKSIVLVEATYVVCLALIGLGCAVIVAQD